MSLQTRLALLISTIKAAYSGLNVRLTAIESAGVASKQLSYANGNVVTVVGSNGKTKTVTYQGGLPSTIVITGGGQTVTKAMTYLADGSPDKITTVVT